MTNGKPAGSAAVTIAARVGGIDRLCADISRVRFYLPHDRTIPRLAGQYLEILDGTDTFAFSIASPPESGPEIELHIRHGADNPSSLRVMSLLATSGTVQVRLPLGDCTLDREPDFPILFLAGSTGFAQVKSFVEHAIAQGFGIPMTICWGARSADGLYLRDLAERWSHEHANIRFIPAISGDAGLDADIAGTFRGLAQDAALENIRDFSRLLVYACGSPAMVYAALDAFIARGLPRERMSSDVFVWAPRPESGPSAS